MNVLVTGSTGFVGRHLMPLLVADGFNILELTRDIDKSQKLFGNTTQKCQIADNHEYLIKRVKEFKPEVVVHLASYLTSGDSYNDMKKLIESNVFFLLALLDALKEAEVKFFINTGTFAEYFRGDSVIEPAYLYAATKSASRYFVDYYSKTYNFSYTTIIPYTIYGGNDSQKKIIDYIFDSLGSDIALDMSPGEQVLDFIHINDVTDFYFTLIKNYSKAPDKSVFNLGTGLGNTIKQLATLMENASGEKCNINWGGRKYRPTDVMFAVADTKNLSQLFQWKADISLEQGLEMYVESRRLL